MSTDKKSNNFFKCLKKFCSQFMSLIQYSYMVDILCCTYTVYICFISVCFIRMTKKILGSAMKKMDLTLVYQNSYMYIYQKFCFELH